MARSSKPVFLFAVSGITSAAATFFLLAWGARPAEDTDGLINGPSGAFVVADGGSGRVPGNDAPSSAPAASASAALPGEFAALVRMVAEDPVAALRSAAELRAPDERRRAVLLVGKLWAWTDPQAALAMASMVPSFLRVDYLAAVSREWANLDSDAFLGFAESATDLDALVGGLELLIPAEPFRVFEIAGPMATGENDWTLVYISVISAMAEQDAMLALRTLETGGGVRDDAMRPTVLRIYGSTDPDGALAWLESLDSPETRAMDAVFLGVAQADFERGYRLLTEEASTSSLESPYVNFDLAATVVKDTASAARVAKTLLAIGTDRAGQMLEGVAAVWARRDPESLVDWMIDNVEDVEPQLARSIGLGIATNDLESALDLVDRLPPAIANSWVAQIAGTYAQQDPIAALDWVDRYRGQAFYDDARAQAVLNAVERNPELIASMLPRMPAVLQASAVPSIATAWVQRDPRAAADWVAGLEGPAAVPGTAREVVRSWMRRDLDAATQWSLNLPRGTMRDEALASLISGSQGVNFDAVPIFEEIESEPARKSAATSMVYLYSETNPDLARRYLDMLVDDEEYGEWARGMLERMAARN